MGLYAWGGIVGIYCTAFEVLWKVLCAKGQGGHGLAFKWWIGMIGRPATVRGCASVRYWVHQMIPMGSAARQICIVQGDGSSIVSAV